MSDVTERINEQRPRAQIEAHHRHIHKYGKASTQYQFDRWERQEYASELHLEVLLDIRDLLQALREWLPSRV